MIILTLIYVTFTILDIIAIVFILIKIIKNIIKEFNEFVDTVVDNNNDLSKASNITSYTIKLGFRIAINVINQIGAKILYLAFFVYLVYFNFDALDLHSQIDEFSSRYDLENLNITFENENDFYNRFDSLDLTLRSFKDKFYVCLFSFVLLFYVPKLADLEVMRRVRIAFKIGSCEILLTLFSICTWVIGLVIINIMLFGDTLSEIDSPVYSKTFETITLNSLPTNEENTFSWLIKMIEYLATSVKFFV